MIKAILFVGLGSFLGGVFRFLLSRVIQGNVHSTFPWGTWVVNVAGCLLIGVLFGLSEKGSLISGEWKLFLTVGICGGFTTFSSFSLENMELLRNGHLGMFMLYAGSSIFLGLLTTFAGYQLVKAL